MPDTIPSAEDTNIKQNPCLQAVSSLLSGRPKFSNSSTSEGLKRSAMLIVYLPTMQIRS